MAVPARSLAPWRHPTPDLCSTGLQIAGAGEEAKGKGGMVIKNLTWLLSMAMPLD